MKPPKNKFNNKIVRRILAAAGCLILLASTISTTCFADQVTDTTDTSIVFSPYFAPESFGTYLTSSEESFSRFDFLYSSSSNLGSAGIVSSSTYQIVPDDPALPIITLETDRTLLENGFYYDLIDLSPVYTQFNDMPLLTVEWGSFIYNSRFFSDVSPTTVGVEFDVVSDYIFYEYVITYFDEDENSYLNLHTSSDVLNAHSVSVGNIPALLNSCDLGQNKNVYVHSIQCTIVAQNEDYGLDVDNDITHISLTYDPLSCLQKPPIGWANNLNPNDNLADSSSLFDWLIDGVGGFFTIPLIPIGTSYITVGSVMGLFLGILLVFAILRFFAGG